MTAATLPARTPLLGIALYMVAITLVVAANTTGKIAMGGLPVWQVVLAQVSGLFFASMLVGRTLRVDRLIGATRQPGLEVLRTCCQMGAALCFYMGLRAMPLADITGITLLLPLAITALAALTLDEQVGWRRWCACGAGLFGALLIARPGFEGAQPAALWPLGTVVLFACYTVLTRRLSSEDSTPTLMIWASLATVIVLGLASPLYWVWPTHEGWAGLVGVCIFSGIANSARIKALALAPASLLAPFGYTQIATATVVGFIVFHELPDGLSWIGIAVVVGSGLYVWHRERRREARS